MKHLRSITLFALLLALGLPIVVQAQPVAQKKSLPGVAFTKTDRSQLWIKRFDTAAYVALKADPKETSHNTFDTIRQLAVLDQSEDGQTLLLGGAFSFYSPWGDNKTITWTGVISIPTDSLSDVSHLLSHVHFLKSFVFNQNTLFRPIGRIAAGRKWFALMGTKAPFYTPGLFRLYHGSLDASFNEGGQTADPGLVIDSATPVQQTSPNNWHCSNIAVTSNGDHAVVVADEQISYDQSQDFAVRIYDWDFSGPSVQLYENTGNLKPLAQGHLQLDTAFGFGLRIMPNAPSNIAELTLSPNGNSLPTFHQFNYYSYNSGPFSAGQAIQQPTDPAEWYYAGMNNGSYQEDNTNAAQHGNAGDIYIGHDGNSVAYISHPKVDTGNFAFRAAHTSIYAGTDISSVQKVYNDNSAQELQPVLVTVAGYEWHYPMLFVSSTGSINFGTVDSGKSKAATPITLSSSEIVATSLVIDSIVLQSGKNFSLTGGTTTQTVLTAGSPITLTPTFKPIDPTAGAKSDTIKIFWNDSAKRVTTVALNGTENIPPPPPPGSVREEDPAVFAMTVQPNPFAQSARISLTAPETGSLAIVVHDALGREVYASQSVRTAAGQSQEFTFDAKSLGLPTGTYYVTALLGDRAATREVVFVK